MKKSVLMFLLFLICLSLDISTIVYAESEVQPNEEVAEVIKEQEEEMKELHKNRNEKSKRILNNMKESIGESYDSFVEMKPLKPGKDFDIQKSMDALTFNIIIFFESLKDGVKRTFRYLVPLCIVLGLASYYIFRKDKPKQRWALLLIFIGPVIFLIILYVPPILSLFTE
ncbi:MAG: hypothetical protein MJA82_06750 [Clostridia bacterium]|nr:hypothetical protein [Clostridia bacterium]